MNNRSASRFGPSLLIACCLVLAACVDERADSPNADASPSSDAAAPSLVDSAPPESESSQEKTDGVPSLVPDTAAWPPGETSQACNVESIGDGAMAPDGTFRVPAGAIVTVGGWALASDARGAAESIRIRLHDEVSGAAWTVPLTLNQLRDDVPRAEGAAQANAGFSQSVAIGSLAPGRYRIVLVAEAGDVSTVCDNGRVILIDAG